ncbi:MAG: Omp28-related outer membrane protein [Flavobacteriales bacterium]|nr:Omp28-related outer membrane protein [Flavobacteriales bacterium]
MRSSMRSIITAPAFALALCAAGQNAYLTNCFVPRYWKANTGYEIAARVRNSVSGAPLITFRVDWRFNNGPIEQGNWQSTTGISPGQYWPYVHQTLFAQPASDGILKVWVVGNGDTDHTNDTLSFPVNVLGAWAAKSVLIEQYTGTWCQFCPSPNATTNALNADPLIVVAKHHNTDELSNAGSTAYWTQFNANYSPAGVMEQEEFGTLPDDAAYDLWGARAEQRKLGVSPASIAIAPAFNAWTRQLTVDVAVTFAAAQSGELVVNAYVLEDNVPGAQTAAPSGYIHHQVVREVLGGATGTAGVIPSTTAAGATYAHQYTLQVPQEWNHGNMRIAAMVTERQNGTTWTVNVSDAGLVEVGVEEQAALRFALFPNPAQDDPWLALESLSGARIQVYSADGRLLVDREDRAHGGLLRIGGFASLPAGLYTVRVEQDGVAGQRRIVKD